MTRKYGTAKEWFTFGLSVFFPGLALFGGSFAAFVGQFEFAVRTVGVVAAVVGLLIVIAGVAVWRYNLGQSADASVVVVGSSSSVEDRRAELAARRDALDLERAGLKPYLDQPLFGGVSRIQASLYGNQTESIETRAERERARVRDTQISAELQSIRRELMEMLRGVGDPD